MKTLELVITDFCNLSCNNCGQGTPWHKTKQNMSMDYLREISDYFEPHEFEHIKISGGEPTLFREFDTFCSELQTLFPAKAYSMATNGKKLKKYLDDIKVFNWIDLSRYPGLNDKEFDELLALEIPNVKYFEKHDGEEMMDIRIFPNYEKKNIFNKCSWPKDIYKIVQDRIYPCCIAFGLTTIRNDEKLSEDKLGVILDHHWRENLQKLNIEFECKQCWVPV